MNIGERIGDYEIVAILGAGGMGQVYKVRNVISDRVEAMKVLLPNLGGDSALADRFLREIKVQATLDHPNIARLNTAQQLGNQLVMLMEYVEGSSIDTLLKDGPMELSESLQCTSQVLDALSYAHARGVVHRDIKPANIMLTPLGVVKLMDFGIARMQADRPLTRTGTTVGSLFYMSPEQINGGLPDLRSDLYSLGVTLYEMVTGRRPFVGDSDYSIMAAHLQQKPVAPIEIIPGVPLDLNDIILMAISKEPEQRFQSADAFHAALRNFARSIGVTLGALPGIAKMAPASAPMPQATQVMPSKTAAPVPARTAAEQLAPTATGISVPVRPAPTVVPAPMPAFQVPPPPAPVFQGPIPPAPVLQGPPAPTKSGSRRGLYMALGSVATLLVLAAAIIEGPKLMHSGASSAATPVAAPLENKAGESPLVPPAPAPSPASDTAQPTAAAPATPAPTRTAVDPAATSTPGAPQAPVRKPPVAAQQVPPRSPAAQRPGQPDQQPAAAQQAPQQPPQQSSQPPARPAASAQLNELRQEYNQVAIRVGAAKSGLRALQQQMQRQGVDMRGDMLEAESRMDYLMQESMGSMRSGDADSARTSLQMAQRSLETIEKFLGR
jgi:serine/threonine protein kinase